MKNAHHNASSAAVAAARDIPASVSVRRVRSPRPAACTPTSAGASGSPAEPCVWADRRDE